MESPTSTWRGSGHPSGIDLGPTDHTGIAVSILAELVAIEASAHPISATVAAPEQAVDPVCEMMVDVAGARWTFDHEGDDLLLLRTRVSEGVLERPGRIPVNSYRRH